MGKLEEWKEAISIALIELIQAAQRDDMKSASEIADVIDAQIAQVTDLSVDVQAKH